MAQITIETSKEEQDVVIKVLKELKGAVTPVSTIASMAGLRQARTRYVLMDLVDQGRIERVASKAFNKHYVRYSYNVLEK
jgi:predicted transcriptional regulator